MSQLYSYVLETPRIDREIVIACVGGELHEVGGRMVADFFEMAGWDTYFLGANTPSDGVIETVREREVKVLGISVTITSNLSVAAELISELRESDVSEVKVLVGGRALNVAPDAWQALGADAYAADAREAVATAAGLVSNGHTRQGSEA
jgi:methylmalonyl-CoA mutase cobalamin-binding domain/chain